MPWRPADTIAALVQAEPDLQTLAQAFTEPLVGGLLALLARADAVVVGPGLGRAPGRRRSSRRWSSLAGRGARRRRARGLSGRGG